MDPTLIEQGAVPRECPHAAPLNASSEALASALVERDILA